MPWKQEFLWRFRLSFLMLAVRYLQHGVFRYYVKGAVVALLHLPVMLLERSRIQRGRTATGAYVDSILIQEMPPTQRAYWTLMSLPAWSASARGP